MKKLEIKHLAPYLPYGLRFMAKRDIWEMNRIDNLDTYTVWACIIWDTKKLAYIPEINHKALYCGHGFQLKEVKPILRPLSDLTKEIEHNGERFVPIDYLIEKYGGHSTTGEWIYLYKRGVKDVDEAPFAVVRKLLEYHFDVFSLIEHDLAININTLEI